jgi:hypothetical protein
MVKLPHMKGKTFIYPALSLILLAGTGYRLSAQQRPIDSLLAIMEKAFPQERIYVQFDRPYYNSGETIWFKAYVFSGNQPSLFSNTLYAELIDEKGKVLQRKTIPVLGAGGASDFALPDTMRSSLVYIRAYTPWMLNFDSSFLYLKPIRIIGAQANKADKTKKEPVVSLQFFPEGGDLVEGVESRVAFKATDDQGFPVAVKGDIVDSKTQKIITFSDTHDGMGYFSLQPAANENYKAVWKDSKGAVRETPLPPAKSSGVVLSIFKTGNNLTYSLNRSENVPADQRVYQVVAHMQQATVYMARINLSGKTKVVAPIPYDELQDGIMQVTLFSADNRPLAERIVFVNNNNYFFNTDLHSKEKSFVKKGKNVLQIDIGDTLITNLSISVTDASATTAVREEENIFSHVLLSSDIKGYVYNPAYYFSSTADSVQANLDLVMMTHGWRRFKWEDVVAEKWPVIKNYPQPFITVNGQVLGLLSSDLVGRGLALILQTKKNNTQFLNVPISPKGEFSINNLLFYDTAKIYYQLDNDKGKKLTSTASFNFKNSFIVLPDKPVKDLLPSLKPVIPDSSAEKRNERLAKLRREEFVEGQKVKLLEGVEVVARQKSIEQKMDEQYTSGFFSGGDGYTFVVENDPLAKSSISVLDYLQGKVAGLQITATGPSGGNLSWRGGTPSLFVNEMNADVSLIQSTPMSDVALIKVFRPPFFGATGGGAGGAIAVYTKKGASANNNVKGLDFISVAGYSNIREFYSPDYSSPAADKDKNDFRATLYWNPFLIFDKLNRRILIPFYNNDNCKKMRVVIEGINEIGKLTREEKYFE